MTMHRVAKTSRRWYGPSALLIAVSLAACSGSPTRSDSGVIEDGRLITGVARLDFTVLDVDGRPVKDVSGILCVRRAVTRCVG
jgi:hypothetical protein